MNAPDTPLLQVEGLRVDFHGRPVVHGLDLVMAPGEKLALVGESGSGKTVTALSLLRLLPQARVSGRVWLGGRDLLGLPEHELQAVRGGEVAMVFQEPMTALNPLFTVGDQVAEVLMLKQGLARDAARRGAIDLLARTGIAEPQRRAGAYPHQLSGGQRQRVLIAMALAGRPRLLLADEPTTALDVSLRGQILDLLDDLRRETGMAVLLITHDLPLVRRFADRVAVMEQGVVVEQGPTAEVFGAPRHPYTRQLVASRPGRSAVPVAEVAPVVLEARGLGVAYPVRRAGWRGWFGQDVFHAVREASFRVRAGVTVGIMGESGSGKSTLALAALGLLPASGELRVDGRRWGRGAAADKGLRQVVQVVFQDPFSSLSPRLTVQEIVGEGLQVHAPALSVAQRRERVCEVLSEVGLPPEDHPGLLGRYPHEFSGGQRQRLAIARALVVQPRLLVLDEPTSALDVTIQHQVLQLLQRLQRERGLAYLLITHDVAVIRAMAHEVLVMQGGQVVESGPLDEVFDQPRHPYTRLLIASSS